MARWTYHPQDVHRRWYMSDLTADNGEQDHEKYSTVGSYVREG
ncbi:hypothetical protein [Kocuria salsicia]|nr:hypothetical protein [Kocuria salsicia]